MTKPTGRPHGGARAGAGRPRGSKTRTYTPHREVEKLVAFGGPSPRDVMLAVMRWHYQAKRYDAAVAVAEKVAVFVHPRLSCGSVTVKPPSVARQILEMTDEELRAHIDEMHELTGFTEGDLATTKPRGRA